MMAGIIHPSPEAIGAAVAIEVGDDVGSESLAGLVEGEDSGGVAGGV